MSSVIESIEKELRDFSVLRPGSPSSEHFLMDQKRVKVVLHVVSHAGFEKIFKTEPSRFNTMIELLLRLIRDHAGVNLNYYNENSPDEFEEEKYWTMIKVYEILVILSGVEGINSDLIQFPEFLPLMSSIWTRTDIRYNLGYSSSMLPNLTIDSGNAEELYRKSPGLLKELLTLFVNVFQSDCIPPKYILAYFGNIAQVKEARREILESEPNYFKKLIEYKPHHGFEEESWVTTCRGNIIKNCCFESDKHGWILGEENNVLAAILIPLISPEDNYTEFEVSKMPTRVKDLIESKKFAFCKDEQIRSIFLEALYLLTAMKDSRELMRENHVYYVLRELHKREECGNNVDQLESVVNLLIQTEEEIGVDNLLQIP